MKIMVFSNGRGVGTEIIDMETGKHVKGVEEAIITMRAGLKTEVYLKFVDVSVDILSDEVKTDPPVKQLPLMEG